MFMVGTELPTVGQCSVGLCSLKCLHYVIISATSFYSIAQLLMVIAVCGNVATILRLIIYILQYMYM